MNNSDTLRFDYTLPASELPHRWYKLYAADKNYSYDEIGFYTRENIYRLPHDLDNLYSPEYCRFLVKGRKIDGGDEILDGGDIVQETNRYVRKRMKKK